MPDGSDGAAGYTQRYVIDSCYNSTCTVSATSNVGGPANTVLSGSDFEVTVALKNAARTGGYHYAHHTDVVPDLRESVPSGILAGGSNSGFRIAPYGPPPSNYDGGDWAPISRSSTGSGTPVGSGRVQIDQDIAPGATGTINFKLRAPNDIQTRQLNIQPLLEDLFTYPAVCDASLKVYKPFALTPYSNGPGGIDIEDPDNIPFNTGINEGPSPKRLPAPVKATTTRTFTASRNGLPLSITSSKVTWDAPTTDPHLNPTSETFDYPVDFDKRPLNGNYTDTDAERFFQAGDVITIKIQIDRATGYVGPGGSNDVVGAAPADDFSDSTVVDRPYVRTYGADVVAGGQFTGNPTPSIKGINAYTRNANLTTAGSGAEFAAIALDTVNGFASDNLRDPPRFSSIPLRLSGLTFASPGGAISGLGGKFAASRLATDYYKKTRMPDMTQVPGTTNQILLQSSGAAGADNGKQNWVKAPATGLELRNPGVGVKYAKRHTLYVEGNVVIKDNIIYDKTDPTESWGSLAGIPNFSLIVKGNIYISSDVEQLDGLYVAQPKDIAGGTNNDPATGKIYTCSKPDGSLYGDAELYNFCRTKLTINGALVSQETKFLRTFGTLSERPFGGTHSSPTYTKETFQFSAGQPAPLTPGFRPTDTDRAAESINLGPEMYLSRPVFFSRSNGGTYDYFVALPPVL